MKGKARKTLMMVLVCAFFIASFTNAMIQVKARGSTKVEAEVYSTDDESTVEQGPRPKSEYPIGGILKPDEYDKWGPHWLAPPGWLGVHIWWDPDNEKVGIFYWDGSGDPPGPYGGYYTGGEKEDTFHVPYAASWYVIIKAHLYNSEDIDYVGWYTVVAE